MMVESWSNLLLIALSVVAFYLGFSKMGKASGATKALLSSVVWSSVVLGVAEVLDLLQLFPDGTFMADLIYEKEFLVLALFIWGITRVKGK